MGNALLRLGDVAAAERVFRGIVGLPPAQLQLATLLFHAGKLEESLAIVERNLPVLPLSLEWHHLRGRILGRLGRHDEAFEADMMEERGGPLVQLTFGKEYLKPFAGSRLTAALDACDRLDPVRDARLLESHLDAIAAMISGRPLPERLPLERQRARMALARQDPDRVEKILDAMESLGTIDGESLMLRAAVAEQRGDAAGAAAWGERAAAVSSAPEVQLNLASDAERAGDIAARDRHRGRGLFLEAAAVFGRNQVPTALEKLRESAALAPAEPTTWFRIGECEAMVGNRAAAEAAYRKALELRPAYGRARDRLERRVPMEGGTPGG
jgi:tetratricopeptide (TPR) repeat protein